MRGSRVRSHRFVHALFALPPRRRGLPVPSPTTRRYCGPNSASAASRSKSGSARAMARLDGSATTASLESTPEQIAFT